MNKNNNIITDTGKFPEVKKERLQDLTTGGKNHFIINISKFNGDYLLYSTEITYYM